jgi:hypothetical protein
MTLLSDAVHFLQRGLPCVRPRADTVVERPRFTISTAEHVEGVRAALREADVPLDDSTLLVAALDEVVLTHLHAAWTHAGMRFVSRCVSSTVELAALQSEVYGARDGGCVRECGGFAALVRDMGHRGVQMIFLTSREPDADAGTRLQLSRFGLDPSDVLYSTDRVNTEILDHWKELHPRPESLVLVSDSRLQIADFQRYTEEQPTPGLRRVVEVHFTAEEARQRRILADAKGMREVVEMEVCAWRLRQRQRQRSSGEHAGHREWLTNNTT